MDRGGAARGLEWGDEQWVVTWESGKTLGSCSKGNGARMGAAATAEGARVRVGPRELGEREGARVRLSEGGKGGGGGGGVVGPQQERGRRRHWQHQHQSVVGRRGGHTWTPALAEPRPPHHSPPPPVSTREKLLPDGEGDARGSLGGALLPWGPGRRGVDAAHILDGEKS